MNFNMLITFFLFSLLTKEAIANDIKQRAKVRNFEITTDVDGSIIENSGEIVALILNTNSIIGQFVQKSMLRNKINKGSYYVRKTDGFYEGIAINSIQRVSFALILPTGEELCLPNVRSSCDCGMNTTALFSDNDYADWGTIIINSYVYNWA